MSDEPTEWDMVVSEEAKKLGIRLPDDGKCYCQRCKPPHCGWHGTDGEFPNWYRWEWLEKKKRKQARAFLLERYPN